MGIFTDQMHDHSKEELVDALGRRWGVFNNPGTGLFIVRCYSVAPDGTKSIDNRMAVPEECAGIWTKREWAASAIKLYISRLQSDTEEAMKRQKIKARQEKEPKEELDATGTSR